MEKKTTPDICEKILEDYVDVFADIINVIVYNGRKVVKEENLRDSSTESRYKAAEGNWGEKRRDICKTYEENGVTLALYGLENQSKISNVMPVRCLGYDYSAYDANIKKIKEQSKNVKPKVDVTAEIWPEQKLYPAVTLVLYFGTTPWTGPRSLHDMLELPEELKSYIPNYHINLVEVAFLPEETIAMFQSDFRIVAEYFRNIRLGIKEDMSYNEGKWIHVAELMDFFHTFLGDECFAERKQFMIDESRKGNVSMSTLFDRMREEEKAKGLAIGLAKGKAIGRTETRYETIGELTKNGFSQEKAMEILKFTAEEVAGYEKWKNK